MTKRSSNLGIAFSCKGNPRELVQSALLAEKAGIESIWLVEVKDADSIGLASAIAQATRKITIGTGVVNSYLRFPTLLAMGAVTVSELSNGRFCLGVGAGYAQMDYSTQIPSNTPATRLAETLQILKGTLHAAGGPFAFEGKLYRIKDFKMDLRSQHKVPIYGAAMGPRLVETVAKYADGVILMLPTLDYLRATIPRIDTILKTRKLRRSSSSSKDSFQVACHTVTVVSDDFEEAERYAKLTIANYATIPIYHQNFLRLGFSRELEAIDKTLATGRLKEAAKIVPKEMVESTLVYGTPKDCKKKLSQLVKAGITLPIVYPSSSGPLAYPERINFAIKALSS